MDFGGIFSAFGGWLSSGMFWFVIAILLTIGVVALLKINQMRKMKYKNSIELISYGNGKVGINKIKVGIFKKNSTLFGLWDYGIENCFKTNDGRIVREATTDDLHDIFSGKGFILRRKDDDPKILVPISKINWKNLEALFEIAPADFRDASVGIVNDATKETQGWMDKYLPYLMMAGMVIFFIVGFILASQFFNRTVDKAGEILEKVSQNAGAARAGASP